MCTTNNFKIFFNLLSRVLGWRLGLQAVTGGLCSLFVLGLFYRSASLYHPQRRAILHLKDMSKKTDCLRERLLGPSLEQLLTTVSQSLLTTRSTFSTPVAPRVNPRESNTPLGATSWSTSGPWIQYMGSSQGRPGGRPLTLAGSWDTSTPATVRSWPGTPPLCTRASR